MLEAMSRSRHIDWHIDVLILDVTEEELQASLDEIRTDFGADLDEVKEAVNIIKAQMDSLTSSLTDLSGSVDAIDTRLAEG